MSGDLQWDTMPAANFSWAWSVYRDRLRYGQELGPVAMRLLFDLYDRLCEANKLDQLTMEHLTDG